MECSAAKATAERDDDGDMRVSLALGSYRAVGCMSEDAWAWLLPEQAEALAIDLQHAARRARDYN